MKKKGDPKLETPMSLLDISMQLADDITRKDSRYDYFVNYEPAPVVMGPECFFTDPRKTKTLFGGNRARKSSYACLESVMIFTGIIPHALRGVYPHEQALRDIAPGGKHHRPRYVRIVVMDFTEHWPRVIRRMLLGDPEKNERGMLPEMWSNWDNYEHAFTGPDDSVLAIFSADPAEHTDPRSMRGGAFDHTWIDEINQETVYTESVVRGSALEDGPKTVTLTYCPQEGYDCWHYETMYKACYDTATKQRKPREKQNPAIFSQKICMRDNPSISPEEIDKIKNSMNDWEWAYRIDGEYSYRGENPYFKIEILVAWEREQRYSLGRPFMIEEKEIDPENGVFEGQIKLLPDRDVSYGGSFEEGVKPVWRIWEMPKHGEKYILSADCAAGNKNSDYQAASVWKCTNKNKPKQVAQLRIRLMKPGEFGQQCCCMANFYGGCLVVPESLNAGEAFIDRVRNYDNLYLRITVGQMEEKETVKYGWSTNVATKGPMLETMYKMINEMAAMREEDGRNYCPFNSQITLQELQGFEERIKRRQDNTCVREWGGRAGTHDDTVMEAAIAFRIISHEYDKISSCIIDDERAKILPDEHKIEKMRTPQHSAFSKMPKQRSMRELQRQNKARWGNG